MASSQRHNDDYLSEINMTPLVDVMLVLLVVMMVTASFSVSRSLEVSLPKAASGETSSPPFTLVIGSDGHWSMGGHAANEAEVQARIAKLRAAGQEPHVVVAAAALSRHRDVVRAMDFLRVQQVTRISLGVMPKEP